MKKQHKPDVGSMLSSVGKVWSERLSLESIEMCYRFAVSKILKIQSFWRLLQVAYSCLDMFRLHAFRLLFGSAVFFEAGDMQQNWLKLGWSVGLYALFIGKHWFAACGDWKICSKLKNRSEVQKKQKCNASCLMSVGQCPNRKNKATDWAMSHGAWFKTYVGMIQNLLSQQGLFMTPIIPSRPSRPCRPST